MCERVLTIGVVVQPLTGLQMCTTSSAGSRADIFCPSCGAQHAADAHYCEPCGHHFVRSKSESQTAEMHPLADKRRVRRRDQSPTSGAGSRAILGACAAVAQIHQRGRCRGVAADGSGAAHPGSTHRLYTSPSRRSATRPTDRHRASERDGAPGHAVPARRPDARCARPRDVRVRLGRLNAERRTPREVGAARSRAALTSLWVLGRGVVRVVPVEPRCESRLG